VVIVLPVSLVIFALTAILSFAPGRHRPSIPAALADIVEIHSAHGTSYVPALQGRRPLFILALGSDARPGEDIEHQRSDSIHIIGINLQRHRATILGIPRDSWVNVPGFGMQKITSAMSLGGPDLTVKTIESLTGIRVDFWLLTSFQGIVSMVNGIGGLSVQVTQPMHDSYSGSNFDPGVHHFDGSQALSFARDRHTFADGDLTRSQNQGVLLVSALSKLHTAFSEDPAALFRWIALGWRNFRTDLGVRTLLDLALTATSIPSSSVSNLVVPATTGVVGAASVVFISPQAHVLYAQMRATGVIAKG